jgi:topoisomerase-4 subunit B
MVKKKDKTLYTENSIVSETPREFCRRVPSTYLGSSKTNTNLIKEVYANSVDEAVLEHGNTINVSVDIDKNKYIVQDFGQGFLINAGIDENGETVMQRSFDVMNTSGKTSADGVYGGSALGVNGIGAKLTNWLSSKLIATSVRDGEYEKLWFKDGIFQKRELGKTSEHSGTTVEWYPDKQFFASNEPDFSFLCEYFEEIGALVPNLTTNFTYIKDGKEKKFVYYIPDGLDHLVTERVGDKELFSNRFIIDRTIGTDSISMCLTYTSDYSDNITSFVNLGKTEGGEHISAFKSVFTRTLNKYAQETNKLKAKEKNLTSNELMEGLYVIFNVTTTTVKYDAQNKSRIDSIDANIINQTISGDFATWLMNNPNEADIILERALVARRAREAAKKAKDKIREVAKKDTTSLFGDFPTKLSDAYPKNRNDRGKCEIYFVEGDSAGGTIKSTRDSTFQACLPVRGKGLNCLKASIDKVYANAEIASIVKALGLDVDKDTGKLLYNLKKLRYSKIIIAVDGDSDGNHISLLFIAALNWLCPELLLNGHVYRVYGALFKVIFPDGTYLLFQDDKSFEAWKEKNPNKKYKVSRAKGLGELTKEEAYEQLMQVSTRNLKQLEITNYDDFVDALEIAMGEDVTRRSEILDSYYEDVAKKGIDIEL